MGRRTAQAAPYFFVGGVAAAIAAVGALGLGYGALAAALGAALLVIALLLVMGHAMCVESRALVEVARRIGEEDFRSHPRPPSSSLALLAPPGLGKLRDAMDDALAALAEGRRARQQLTAELQRVDEHARWLHAGLRDTQDGFLVLDREQRIVYVNPAWLRIRELEGVDVVGRPAAEVASSEGAPPELLAKIQETLQANQPWMGTVTSKRRDGSVRELDLSISPVFNDKGEIEHFVEFARDATERRATELAIQRSERLASLGMLAAGMAHEINNPMTYVMANLELLGELARDKMLTVAAEAELELAQCLDDSIQGVRRVVEIVADLQALSRQRQDRGEGKANAVVTLETCVRMAQSQLRHCAEVVRDFPEQEVWLSINPQRLGQVLLNLILNAAQAMSTSGTTGNKLTLRVRALGDGRGELEVRDTGSGMSREVQLRIFDPFFTTKGTGGGTGLGLSISHSIITAAKGEIAVESEPGQGTCFRVRLPLAAVTASFELPAASATLQGLSVLVVDDEPGVLTAIRRMLGNCQTTTATSAAMALEKIQQEHFDLVLSDVMMAEQSGVALVQVLRTSKPELARRVCLMSAGVIGGELMQEVQAIGVPLLLKPMTSEELHRTLWRVHRGEG